jgi:carboxyl-terminal processing protease
MTDKKLNFLLPLGFALVLAAGMLIGFELRETTWDKRPLREGKDFRRLDEVVNILEEKYVDTINKKQTIDRVIDGLMEQLDPHSFYIAVSDVKGVKENLEGLFEGIGVEFYILRDTIIVVSPISGGPSEKLGILAGDRIIYINDSLVAGTKITNSDVIKKLRGRKGTKVKVSIARKHHDELLDFVITRDEIPIFSVDAGFMVDAQTGYIKINRFSEDTYQEFIPDH